MAIILYAVIALSMTSVRAGTELYPFFNWSLFSSASAERSTVVVIFRSINGQTLPEPKMFYDVPEAFYSARTRDSRFAKAMDRLYASILAGDQQTEEAVRRVVEQTFLREAREADYDLAVISYDPIARYKTGRIDSLEIVKSYRKSDAAE